MPVGDNSGQKTLEDSISEANKAVNKMTDIGIIITNGVRGNYMPIGQIAGTTNTPRIPNMPTGVASLNSGPPRAGFLPLGLISPVAGSIKESGGLLNKFINKEGYKIYDWTGQRIEKRSGISNLASKLKFRDTEDRFNISKDIPKSSDKLKDSPYSTRDIYAIFNDKTTDYFKHGLQAVYGLNPIVTSDYWDTNKNTDWSIGNYPGTPFENQDPVMFGFEVIIDNLSSPLLNGAVTAFLNNYSMINEINSKKTVYEDFKNQLGKFFKTKTTMKVDEEQLRLTANKALPPNLDGSSKIYNFGKNAYLGFYLNGIKGLDKLVESNTSIKKKYITDYGNDLITLDFLEDVSLSFGTLAHLYKLLYWSKPQGKGLVPENLLRFNCEIIVSECRSFNRVRKAVNDGNLEVIKDNVSRYVYSLRECQFYFDKMPHEDTIDLGSIKTYDKSSISFDYKYSTVRLEKFTPTGNGFGVYQGYNGGALWKIGNPGSRDQRNSPDDLTKDSSIPKFYTIGQNPFNENGLVDSKKKPAPFVIAKYGSFEKSMSNVKSSDDSVGKGSDSPAPGTTVPGAPAKAIDDIKSDSKSKKKEAFENIKKMAIGKGNDLKDQYANPQFYKNLLQKASDVAVSAARESIDRQISDFGNIRQQLLQETLNKIKSAVFGSFGNIYLNDGDKSKNPFPKHMPKNPLYNSPRNVYTDSARSGFGLSAVFYDVRGELLNFAGDTLGDALGNGTRI